jgi:hypothetical protein
MTQANPPGYPPTWPRADEDDRPLGPLLSNDGSHERLYNPDGWGCGAPVAVALVLAALILMALPVGGLLLIGGNW